VQVHVFSRAGRAACVLLLSLAPVVQSAAQDNQSPADARPSEEQSLLIPEGEAARGDAPAESPLVSSWDFVRMLIILAAVVGVIYLIFHFLKRGLRRQLPDTEIIKLLGTRNLAGNRSLHVVELGKSVFLLGAAEGGITLISEVKDQETLDTLRLERSRTLVPAQGFGQFFQSILKSGRSAGVGVQRSTVDFMKQQRQRLNKM
jgi:flagellar protein FliO/FliZ